MMTMWLCIDLPKLALERAANVDDAPAAAVEQIGQRRVVIHGNRAARAYGSGVLDFRPTLAEPTCDP